jgi:hypothetical protein
MESGITRELLLYAEENHFNNLINFISNFVPRINEQIVCTINLNSMQKLSIIIQQLFVMPIKSIPQSLNSLT